MNQIMNKRGFSLVELMLATIATGILALTFGTTIYFIYKGWNQNLAATQLQQDEYATMRKITKEIRLTERSKVTVQNPGTLILGANADLALPERSFSVINGNLLFNSSSILIDNKILISPNIFAEYFDENGDLAGVEVTLQLENADAGHSSSNLFIVHMRN